MVVLPTYYLLYRNIITVVDLLLPVHEHHVRLFVYFLCMTLVYDCANGPIWHSVKMPFNGVYTKVLSPFEI